MNFTTQSKTCPRCQIEKPFSAFRDLRIKPVNQTVFQLNLYCRACQSTSQSSTRINLVDDYEENEYDYNDTFIVDDRHPSGSTADEWFPVQQDEESEDFESEDEESTDSESSVEEEPQTIQSTSTLSISFDLRHPRLHRLPNYRFTSY